MNFWKKLLLTSLLTTGAVITLGTNVTQAAENYTVQSGDTLSKISVKFSGDNSLINTIAKENNISNVDTIWAGQNLTINTEAKSTPPTTLEPATAQQQPATPAIMSTPANTNAAKEWIAQRESSGSYTATNGQYIGRYQLSAAYLNGDYSVANQERVAEQYVASRYGSWEGAKSFWLANGWY